MMVTLSFMHTPVHTRERMHTHSPHARTGALIRSHSVYGTRAYVHAHTQVSRKFKNVLLLHRPLCNEVRVLFD